MNVWEPCLKGWRALRRGWATWLVGRGSSLGQLLVKDTSLALGDVAR